jgi:hypothetical protein
MFGNIWHLLYGCKCDVGHIYLAVKFIAFDEQTLTVVLPFATEQKRWFKWDFILSILLIFKSYFPEKGSIDIF